jgi:nitrite reductase/ring-hydroxylating ferredoxin subunit
MTAGPIDVGSSEDLGDAETRKFHFREAGQRREGFVIRWDGSLRAYRNECRHIPVTLDWVENRFLSRDRCYIQCATHGALYDPGDGACVSGPPSGLHLRSLPLEVRNGRILVTIPAESSL